MKICKLYIMCSYFEGYPNSLVEALLVSRNVISSNCKCGPEEFLQNENKTRLFDPKNVNDIAAKIEKYINSKIMNINSLKNRIMKENSIYLGQ